MALVYTSVNGTNLERVSFAGHETFAFRHGWLKKGVDAIMRDPTFFTRDDALVHLGVGKNMVRSIRYWCLATRMAEEDPEVAGNRGRHLRITALARALLGDGAWDPYLEDPASLWLLHWLLVSNAQRATTWHLGFTAWHEPDFTKPRLLRFLQNFTSQQDLPNVADSSLERDIDCFVRTYVPSRVAMMVLVEDTLDCPLIDLRLIQSLADHDAYRFIVGPKPSLPSPVVGFAVLEYFAARRGGRHTLSLEECLYGTGSPGQAFKLDANSLVSHLEALEQLTEGALGPGETGGLKQIYRRRPFEPLDVLALHYAPRVAA